MLEITRGHFIPERFDSAGELKVVRYRKFQNDREVM